MTEMNLVKWLIVGMLVTKCMWSLICIKFCWHASCGGVKNSVEIFSAFIGCEMRKTSDINTKFHRNIGCRWMKCIFELLDICLCQVIQTIYCWMKIVDEKLCVSFKRKLLEFSPKYFQFLMNFFNEVSKMVFFTFRNIPMEGVLRSFVIFPKKGVGFNSPLCFYLNAFKAKKSY